MHIDDFMVKDGKNGAHELNKIGILLSWAMKYGENWAGIPLGDMRNCQGGGLALRPPKK